MIPNSIKKRLLGLLTSAALALGLAASLPVTSPAIMTAEAAAPSTKQIVADMGLGWNLGNSLESNPGSESSWGNPRTTQNTIKAVKARGFKTIRIPVTWYNHMDSNKTIDSAWMARVKEVVDWAIDENMYVILNTHHEPWNEPTEANYSNARSTLITVWDQIAKEFKDYDSHLIFEGLNEPRDYEVGYDDEGNPKDDWYGNSTMWNNINLLNKAFVETVRNTGGNNSTRALMLPTYAASVDTTLMNAWQNLSGDTNIIVSLHAYSPYHFAMAANDPQYGSIYFNSNMESQLNDLFTQIGNVFVSKGLSVCIGEFNASDWSNQSERVKWAECYANNVKNLNNKYSNASVSAVIWDNDSVGSNGSEYHYYLNRNDFTWYSNNQPILSKLFSVIVGSDNPSSFTPVYESRDGYADVPCTSSWVEKLLYRDELLAGNDPSNVISITLKSNYTFKYWDNTISGFKEVYEHTITLDEIPTDGYKIAFNYSDGKTRTIEWKVNKIVNGVYKQFTELDADGKYTQRGVIELAESKVDEIDYVNITFTYPAIGYTKTIKCTKYYTGIKAGDTTYRPADGYVYIIATLKNIPNSSVPIDSGLDVSYELVYKT